MKLKESRELSERIKELVVKLGFDHIDASRIKCFRSTGSKARVYARIWELPKIWQKALDLKPHYAIEVLEEKFDRMSQEEQDKILIHELLHIPYTFSGALRPHNGIGVRVDHKTVDHYHKKLKPNIWEKILKA